MGKRILFLTLIFSGIVLAGSFHTLPLNGSNTFVSDEQFITSTDTITAYCTWDSQFLYLGSTAGFLSSINDTVRSTYDLFYYIDTDPHPDNPRSGNGHAVAATYWTQIMPQQPFWFDEQSWSLPFNADYYVRGIYDKKDTVSAEYGPWDENSQIWGLIELDTTFANLSLEQAYYEVKIPWDSLGNPTHIFILGTYVSNEWESDIYWVGFEPNRDVGGTLGSWPNTSIEGGDGDKGPDGKFNHWFSFEITSGISPTLANDNPVVSDIPGQAISQGDLFTTLDLNTYVFDDLSPDSLINWTYSGNINLDVTISNTNQATISVLNSGWTGSDTITFIANDEGGKTDSDTAIFTVNGPSAINEKTNAIPDQFTVKQNYPNPFNPSTTVSFGLPDRSAIQLDVFNLLGQNIYSVKQKFSAGFHTITIDAGQWPAGTYIYRIQAGQYSENKKMILIK